MRGQLHEILAEALPWDGEKVSFCRTIFPQMTQWLPDEEAAQLRFEFDRDMERLSRVA